MLISRPIRASVAATFLIAATALLGACTSPQVAPIDAAGDPAATPAATPTESETETLDSYWESRDYMTAISGNVYIKFSDKGSFMCDWHDCTQVELHVEQGCPSMLYVEANVTSRGTVVGYTNATPGAVAPDSNVKLLLEDIRGAGDGFKLTKVNCY